ncbi:MAG: Flp pilus assembly complex ATPase component TadA [Promicromonosporaceae bacterium]|nr:Flp pilus assembly complex ATPase component TadA [Promicromonosporaceae bacterium]
MIAIEQQREAAQILGREVRELVRQRGIDPMAERAEFDRLVTDVLDDYADRAARGLVPAVTDATVAARRLTDSLAGFGPLQQYLDDPEVTEIWLNSPAQVFVERFGLAELTTTILTTEQVRDLVERMLKSSGRRLDLSSPFVDAALPDGSRLHVVIPDVTRTHLAVNIRKHVVSASRLDHLVRLGSLSAQAAAFLDAAVRAGLNILVAGATQAGKTTLLNALAGSIPAGQRVITAEEVFELRLEVRDLVAMQCRQPSLEGTGEIPLRRLVKEALRMRPDRIVVGEVREAESLDLLIALNSGVPGMCTIHANTAREAITKLCVLPLLAGENVTSAFVVPTVAAAIDVVVHLRHLVTGARRVAEIVAVTGRVEEGRIELAELFRLGHAGYLVRGGGYPGSPERFAAAGIDIRSLLAGGG